jgi:ribosomal protein S18 acetylase RimI-like enzyme
MVRLSADRDGALRALHDAMRERMADLTLDAVERAFEPFVVRAITKDGTTIGALVSRGPEVHVAVLPEFRGRWLSARFIREVLSPILSQWGYATATVMADNYRGQRFVERLGFKREREVSGIIHYRLNAHEGPHARSH